MLDPSITILPVTFAYFASLFEEEEDEEEEEEDDEEEDEDENREYGSTYKIGDEIEEKVEVEYISDSESSDKEN